MGSFDKYLAVFGLSAIQTLKNYKALFGLSIFMVTCLLIFAHLWEVVAPKIGAAELHPAALLWFIALNEWVLVSVPHIHEDMEEDLRSGKLAYHLPRPISYLGFVFSEALGAVCVNLFVLGIVCFGFAWLWTGTFPFSAASIPFLILLAVSASVVALIYIIAVGLSAFWFHQVSPCFWMWEKLLFTLGGLMIPLTVYPEWLQKIAAYTPFPPILGQRSALAITFSWPEAFHILGLLLFWGLCGAALLVFIYKKGLRIVSVEGG